MNKLILPILLFLFGCSKHIQQEISTTDYKDSILKKLDHLSIENPDSSINYTKHLLQVDSLFIDSAFYYSLIENIARCKFNMGEPDSSLYYFSAPLQYWEKGKTNEARKKHAQLLYNYAFTLKESGNLKRSLNFFNKSIEVAKNTDNAKLLISPYLLKSEILASEDNYGEAIECIENSIVACSAIKDSALMISCLQAYADIYVNCNFYKEAEMQFDETIKFKKHFKPISSYCHSNGKGRMYYLQGEYSKAKQEFIKAYEQCDKLDQYCRFLIEMNLAETCLYLHQLDSAKQYLYSLKNSHAEFKMVPTYEFQFNSLWGEYQRQNKNFKSATNSLNVADSVLLNNQIDNVLIKLHKYRKATLNADLGNFEIAFSEIKNYNELNKKILNQASRRQVASLKYKFQRDTTVISQNNHLVQNKQEIKNYKLRQSVFATILLIIAVTGAAIYLYYRKTKQLNYEKNRRKVVALKMESMRSRLSPHFLFNVLASLSGASNQSPQTIEKIKRLSLLLRKTIQNIDQTAIPLKEELEAIKAYVELFRENITEPFIVKYLIEENVDMGKLIPAMMLQIPVENAIKHGLMPLEGEKELTISISKLHDRQTLKIEDNGIGLEASAGHSTGTGTGLKVLLQTIHLLNVRNQNKITFSIHKRTIDNKQTSGTTVEIEIPFDYNYNLS